MAKTSILTILIQLAKRGNADRETIKGLAQLKQNVGLAMGAFAAFSGVAIGVGVALGKTVTAFVDYAAQVREMSRLTGASAEETSRLIQAADDVTISYEALQKALWFASKNGVEVNIDSIGRLADQYVALAGPTEKAEFLAKNFGKGGAEMAKLLEGGSRSVRSLTDAISDNLVLSAKAVQQARDYEIAQDNLNDQWEAFKIGVGQKVVPALNNLLFVETHISEIWVERNRLLREGVALNYADANSLAIENVRVRELTQGQEANAMAMHVLRENAFDAAEGIQEVAEAEAAFNSAMGELNTILGGELGDAQDEYNAKIAEYVKQLGAAKTLKEKDEINANIAAETEAYNARSQAIMFNIQQEAILNSTLPSDTKLAMITSLGVAYGEYDQATASAILTSNTWISNLEAGTVTEEQAIAALTGITERLKETGKAATGSVAPLKDEGTALYHVGQRAIDGSEDILGFKEAQAEMGSAVRKDATPAVGGLARSFGGLPPDGTEWNYHFNITKSGSVPQMPAGTPNSSTSGGLIKADYEFAYGAAGGQLGSGWTMVGEAGYELISPTGYVFTNQESRALMEAGLIPGEQRMFGGGTTYGDIGGTVGSGYRPSTSGTRRRRRSSGDRGTIDTYYSNSSYSGAGGGEISPPSVQAAAAVVSDVVEPLAGVTEEAVQAFGATQQQQVSEGIQTRNTIAAGNGEMTSLLRDISEQLRQQQANFARAVAAAVEQVKG